ncbi:MAG: hypothetical protein GY761_19210 [Hyphomicrobiales bacterium]|nr:hypothetical protein [Hyphomicrobiales bacterium]
MINLQISAIDTLMFRDGRPFNQADAGASEAVSVFPPYPPTVVGAIRAALWRQLGNWDKKILGNGTNWQATESVLGDLCFGAPQLLCDGVPVFPVPLHIVEGNSGNGNSELTWLSPGITHKCDLGEVRLPEPVDANLAGIKTIEDRWLTAVGMQEVLDGRLPDRKLVKKDIYSSVDGCHMVKRECLWQGESRVGIGINPDTRTTENAQLYMANHARMQDGVCLQVQMDGYKRDFRHTIQPLAGEHRMADITVSGIGSSQRPAISKTLDEGRYLVICLSPLVIDRMPKSGGNIDGLPGKVTSACLGKPVVFGGWNSTEKPCGPIPLRQCIPAGSVWFMQGDENINASAIPTRIGKATQWGFGQVLIGKWQERYNG